MTMHFGNAFADYDAARQALAIKARSLPLASGAKLDAGPPLYNPPAPDWNSNSYSGVIRMADAGSYFIGVYSRSTPYIYREATRRFVACPSIPNVVPEGFNGVALLPSGRPILNPYSDPRLLAYNPQAEAYDTLASGLTGPHKWSGVGIGAGGQAVLPPHRSRTIGVVNENAPAAQRFRQILIPDLPANSYAFGGPPIALPDGKMLFAPHDQPRGMIFDPLTDQHSWTAPICATPEGLWGGRLLTASKVIFYNHKHDRPVVFDFVSGVVTPFPVAVGTMGVANFNGGVALADDRDYLIAFQSVRAPIVDTWNGTVTWTTGTFGGGACKGGCLMDSGDVLLASFNLQQTVIAATGHGGVIDPDMLLSEHRNRA